MTQFKSMSAWRLMYEFYQPRPKGRGYLPLLCLQSVFACGRTYHRSHYTELDHLKIYLNLKPTSHAMALPVVVDFSAGLKEYLMPGTNDKR